MFEKKTYIYNEAMGVCHIDDITKLISKKKEEVLYYVLRSYYEKDKVAYIPVQNHTVVLRELISLEEATAKKEALSLGEHEPTPEEVEQAETFSMEMELMMAETLPEEKRKAIYERGEIEFVISKAQEQVETKKK